MKINLDRIILFLIFISVFIQIPLFLVSGSSYARFYHLLIPILFLIILFRKEIIFFVNDVFIFFIFILFSIAIHSYFYSFNIYSMQIIFCMLIYYIVLNIAYYLKNEEQTYILKLVFMIFLFIVLFKCLFYYDSLLDAYETKQASLINVLWIVAGNHNLELTYISFIAIFYIKEKIPFYILLLLLIILSTIYMSRIGIVEVFILLYFKYMMKFSLNKNIYYIFILSCLLCVFLILIFYFFDNNQFIERFTNIEEELNNTSSGRGMLWYGGLKLLEDNIFGYGIGNSISLTKEIVGKNFLENNFHNIYLQYMLDLGVIPMLFYFYIIIKRIILSKDLTLKLFIIIFSLVSFIQFTGYDIVFWSFLALNDINNFKYRLNKGYL
ncbi:O-antigen ligase family protein [Malaciobacter marinus]|uniref:O-antigen ligase family protein n=1 Tax=Malaciobacter marinus TaxID=505249 RepID=UPI003B0077B8